MPEIRNYTLNFGPQHPAAQSLVNPLMRISIRHLSKRYVEKTIRTEFHRAAIVKTVLTAVVTLRRSRRLWEKMEMLELHHYIEIRI